MTISNLTLLSHQVLMNYSSFIEQNRDHLKRMYQIIVRNSPNLKCSFDEFSKFVYKYTTHF